LLLLLYRIIHLLGSDQIVNIVHITHGGGSKNFPLLGLARRCRSRPNNASQSSLLVKQVVPTARAESFKGNS
jgi:hypothetical protein